MKSIETSWTTMVWEIREDFHQKKIKEEENDISIIIPNNQQGIRGLVFSNVLSLYLCN